MLNKKSLKKLNPIKNHEKVAINYLVAANTYIIPLSTSKLSQINSEKDLKFFLSQQLLSKKDCGYKCALSLNWGGTIVHFKGSNEDQIEDMAFHIHQLQLYNRSNIPPYINITDRNWVQHIKNIDTLGFIKLVKQMCFGLDDKLQSLLLNWCSIEQQNASRYYPNMGGVITEESKFGNMVLPATLACSICYVFNMMDTEICRANISPKYIKSHIQKELLMCFLGEKSGKNKLIINLDSFDPKPTLAPLDRSQSLIYGNRDICSDIFFIKQSNLGTLNMAEIQFFSPKARLNYSEQNLHTLMNVDRGFIITQNCPFSYWPQWGDIIQSCSLSYVGKAMIYFAKEVVAFLKDLHNKIHVGNIEQTNERCIG